jgi:hypothetical protein
MARAQNSTAFCCSNAEYWYRRCDAAPSTLTLDEEWQELALALLGQS